MLDLKALRECAEKASQGDRLALGRYKTEIVLAANPIKPFIKLIVPKSERYKALPESEFLVAFSPSVALELIGEIDRTQKDLTKMIRLNQHLCEVQYRLREALDKIVGEYEATGLTTQSVVIARRALGEK